ncbi:PLDc N-terminal domain-containing protein [Sphingobacterium sp.]|uniref:PLDc N-terminal domain-containing protein n=1 Tax=Sphingobacterium sp. TaxID=341027 RepID=UPI00338EDE6F
MGITELVLVIIPALIIILTICHIVSNPNISGDKKGTWVVLVLLFNIIGCILYFTIGNKKKQNNKL